MWLHFKDGRTMTRGLGLYCYKLGNNILIRNQFYLLFSTCSFNIVIFLFIIKVNLINILFDYHMADAFKINI